MSPCGQGLTEGAGTRSPSVLPNDADRVYGFPFAGLEVRFTVDGEVLTVCEILEATV